MTSKKPEKTVKKIYPHTACERRHLGLLSGRNSTGNTSHLLDKMKEMPPEEREIAKAYLHIYD
ncbi:hypothetical protein A2996_02260 [Candidatus Campbellbacteria bacterium RIFCSPLOWO2_01_FULL_34_15]|uniref:Uncharacterized protein n=2 Tax=Candidatus Campbelliibacteriota TaxID=1752727 RepID=A0A1F5ENS2_9BACT|nr:MAG: hypothetical protein A2996_02260 [Candidatus Campbellbacteria bacterium RIFCSPLOWO2_01_FULL_34_15]OGD69370.1 MAG: hypothetical protein A2811_00800 [Candidatus Campbellbacteria bacterium RIFCSPHIGHO2_01_FULL_34_10]